MRIECDYPDCGFIVESIGDAISHDKVHQRSHRQAKFFTWWLGEYLGTYISRFEYVKGLEQIEMIDSVLYIDDDILDGYHLLYQNYLKGTCRIEPCMDCIKKNAIRTMPQRKYMAYKMRTEGKYEPDRPRITPHTLNTEDEQLI